MGNLIHRLNHNRRLSPPRPAEKIIEGLKEALVIAKNDPEPRKTRKPKRSRKTSPSKESSKKDQDKAAEEPAVAPRRGRPATGKARRQISLRLDADVVEHFEAKGEGWRSLINDALRTHMEKN